MQTPGRDGTSIGIYNTCKDLVAEPLAHIFNLVLDNHTFPRLWTLTAVTLVPKPEAADDIANHRPIANISVPNEIFEKVILLDLYKQTHKYKILTTTWIYAWQIPVH